jgi:hypothetical protein
MGDQSPHFLSITIGGCLLVVATLAVVVVIGILIVVGLAVELILLPALLTKAVSRRSASGKAGRAPVTRRGKQGGR